MTKKEVKRLTFLTYCLGCRTNQAEINKIGKELTQYGFTPSEEEPNVILINTCVVTDKAERETRKAIRHFRRLYPNAFLVVSGCGVDAKQKLKINLPEADLFIENLKKQKTSGLIARHFQQRLRHLSGGVIKDKYFLSGRALLKIQEGCNKFCSYCIVPFLRGKPKSLPPEKVVQQINKLGEQGVEEVVLTGINLALYGKDLEPITCLTELLGKILKETRIERTSLSSIEPDIVDKNFIDLFLKNKRLSRYFHLALQSGSSTILKRMGRKTNLKKLLGFLLLIKQKIPEFVFRTDILVGFPGETEKEFKETIDFVKKAKISFAHVFPYSQRPGTKASFWVQKGVLEDLPKKIKKQRARILQSVVKKIRLQEGKGLVGKTLPCLFIQKEDFFYRAIASNSWPVKIFCKEKNLRGKIKEVNISGYQQNFLLGNLG